MQLRAPAATSMAIHDPGKKISNRTICAALQTMIGIAPKFGVEKYFVHQKNVFNKSRLRSDTRVKFKVETSEKGLVAVDVKLEKIVEESAPLTDNDIKAMFGVLLVFQIIIAYFVFFG